MNGLMVLLKDKILLASGRDNLDGWVFGVEERVEVMGGDSS